jgi:tetratricopeptide (TPR) repeat protein
MRPDLIDDEENPVEALIDQAWEAPTPVKRAGYARKALALDPDAVDAYVALALTAATLAEQIALLREGMRVGAKRWVAEIKRPPKCFFWADLETRPYMRAVHNLALALWLRGERAEAANLADHLVRLNPNDNQGARYLCLAWHPVLGNWRQVERLLARYKGEYSTHYLYACCLDATRLGGDADSALADALQVNPHVPEQLLARCRLQGSENRWGVAFGSVEEAAAYAENNLEAWGAVSGALTWLVEAVKRVPPREPAEKPRQRWRS